VIDVAFTAAEIRHADVAVVVDVLRATSTATQALASGYRLVLMADTIERARALDAPNRVLAGERDCVVVPGFKLGNSPIEATRRYAEELVLATTNGTPTVVAAAARAERVMLGCLMNLDAVLARLDDEPEDARIQVVCSGTDGEPALEDIYVAGRICAALSRPRTDAAHTAVELSDQCPDALRALASSANGRRLHGLGADDDIAYCARESVTGVVGHVADVVDGVATVVPPAGTVIRMYPRTTPARARA
jgi:2-phosphosulfolactate phosphatase